MTNGQERAFHYPPHTSHPVGETSDGCDSRTSYERKTMPNRYENYEVVPAGDLTRDHIGRVAAVSGSNGDDSLEGLLVGISFSAQLIQHDERVLEYDASNVTVDIKFRDNVYRIDVVKNTTLYLKHGG